LGEEISYKQEIPYSEQSLQQQVMKATQALPPQSALDWQRAPHPHLQ
jgi:hypothetical protein